MDDILPVLMRNNAEPEACDLCMEVDQLERLLQPGLIERAKHERVCLYLVSCAQYLPEPEDRHALRVAYRVYLRAGAYARALRVALMMGDAEAQAEVMAAAPARSAAKRQLELMLHPPDLSEHLKRVARELEIHEAKTPEDIYKSHLVESMRRFGSAGGAAQMDSARQNLAATLVNALVNCGFSTDKLIVEPVAADAPNWIFRNKSHGLLSATASLGLIFLYDRDGGVAEINKYLDSPEEFVRAGAMLAIGMLGGGRVEDEFDTALALLSEPAEQSTGYTRLCAILGLGLAYAGTRNAQVSETLIPIVADAATTTETAAVAALALGLVFVSSADPDLTATLIQAMADHLSPGEAPNEGDAAEPMQTVDGVESAEAGDRGDGDAKKRPVEEATSNATAAATESSTTETAAAASSTPRPPPPPRPVHPLSHLFPLALGLLYLRCGGASIDAVIEAAEAMGGGSVSTEVLEVCAHYGSGDVLTVQKFLAGGTEWTPLAVALVSGGEEIGQRMALRLFEHLQQYGNEEQKRTVPLALGALCVSDPRLEVIDALSKLSHDHDTEVAAAAVLIDASGARSVHPVAVLFRGRAAESGGRRRTAYGAGGGRRSQRPETDATGAVPLPDVCAGADGATAVPHHPRCGHRRAGAAAGARRTGGGHGGTSRPSENHHRLSDAHHAGAAERWRARRARHRRLDGRRGGAGGGGAGAQAPLMLTAERGGKAGTAGRPRPPPCNIDVVRCPTAPGDPAAAWFATGRPTRGQTPPPSVGRGTDSGRSPRR
eukprot:ctg_1869.g399